MSIQIVTLLFCSLIGVIYSLKNRLQVGIISIYILSNVLFIGLYPISDFITGNYSFGLDVFFLSVLYICIINILFIASYKFFINKRSEVSLLMIKSIKLASKISYSSIYLLFIISLITIGYYFNQYGLLFRVSDIDIPELNQYRQVMINFVFPVLYFVSFVSFSKILQVKTSHRPFLISIVLIITLYLLCYGRREFIFLLVILGLSWYFHERRKPTLKSIFLVGSVIVLLILGSNLYQNLRLDIRRYGVTKEMNIDKPITDLLFDFKKTESNLQERPSALPIFSSALQNVSLSKYQNIGSLTVASFFNVVPQLINPEKKNVNDDQVYARKLNLPPTDFNTNLYTSLYLDFYWLGILVHPIFLLIYFLLSAAILRKIASNSFLSVVAFLEVAHSAFSVETTITGILVSFRLLVIILIVFTILSFIPRKTMRKNK